MYNYIVKDRCKEKKKKERKKATTKKPHISDVPEGNTHTHTQQQPQTNKQTASSVHDFQPLPVIFSDIFKNKIPSIGSSFSRVARKNNDCQLAFSGAPFLSFTAVSEEYYLLKILYFKLSPRHPWLIRSQVKFSTKTLKSLLPTMTNIFNESLTSDPVPAHFKTAVVKSLLKKPSLEPKEWELLQTDFLSTLSVKTSERKKRRERKKKQTCSWTASSHLSTQSAQYPSVYLHVRAQHRDCSPPRTQQS